MRNRDLMADLYDRARGMVAPTQLRWFTPDDQFWVMLEKLNPDKSKVIVELGAGRGDTMRDMQARGYKVCGFDLNAPLTAALFGLHAMNALRAPMTRDMLVLACRPDHSGWVDHALDRAREAGATFVYVGLPDNVERDLDVDETPWTQNFLDVGEEGEIALVFEP